jgi:malate dehydrogenase
MKKIRVAVSGGAGALCYNLLFRIADGEVFGMDTSIELSILEIPASMQALSGVKMELLDCAYPLLSSVNITDSADAAFEGADYVFLVGAKPRSKGMERIDLLKDNGKIFVGQGKAVNRAKDAKILVVGNPCNTNALILKYAAKDISPLNICAMTRLDQNRAVSMIAEKAGVGVSTVSDLVIWGNHSSSMVIDYLHAKIEGKPLLEVIEDKNWLEGKLFDVVQNRGSEILAERGLSSAASAANAAIDAMKDWLYPSDKSISAGVYTDGNPYGIADDLYFSFPIQNGEIVSGLTFDPFLEEKIKLSEKELLAERDMIREYLK